MIDPVYSAAPDRYHGGMKYRRAGKSGILLPEISLGLWHNFGDVDTLSGSKEKIHHAFDKGITYIDLANNYYCCPIKSIAYKKSCSAIVYSMAESCFVILSPCQK